jgi:hypothetical protein
VEDLRVLPLVDRHRVLQVAALRLTVVALGAPAQCLRRLVVVVEAEQVALVVRDEAVVLAVRELLVTRLPLVIDVTERVVLGGPQLDLVAVEVRVELVAGEAVDQLALGIRRAAVPLAAAFAAELAGHREVTEVVIERAVLEDEDDELLVLVELLGAAELAHAAVHPAEAHVDAVLGGFDFFLAIAPAGRGGRAEDGAHRLECPASREDRAHALPSSSGVPAPTCCAISASPRNHGGRLPDINPPRWDNRSPTLA